MKICFIGNNSSVHTHRWVGFFVKKGHDVSVISRVGEDVEGAKNYLPRMPPGYKKYPRVIKRFLGNIIYWFFIIRKLREIRPDVINALSLFPYGLFAVYSFYTKKVKIAMSPWGTDVMILGKKYTIFRYLARKIFEKSDLIQVDSREMMKISLWIGAPKKKTVLICIPGVDTRLFKSSKKKIPGSIISTRTFWPVYNLETTIMAFALALKENPKAVLLMAGDGPLREELKTLAKSLGIEKNIKWLGLIPHEKLKDYLSKSEIYISSSLTDSTPVSLLEAMASSLPSVVSDVPASMEWVKDGYNGLVFKKKDYITAAKEILTLLKDGKKRREFGKRSEEIVFNKADYFEMMKRFEKELERLVKQKKN
jgi:glycosyltransferase involved in cell wall biosynthesis